MEQKIYVWESEVRDYELDLQGVVNNANYLHYFEHARHNHLKELGIDFNALHQSGYDLVLVKTEIVYKQALYSGDKFSVDSMISRLSRLKYCFSHTIRKLPDNSVVASSSNIVSCISNTTRKPSFPDNLQAQLGASIQN